MMLKTTFAVFLAVSASALITVPAAAQEEDKVVARVNSYEIKTSEVSLAAEELSAQLGNLPRQNRYPFIVQYLIERHLLAQAGQQQKMDQTSEYKKRLDYYQSKALRDAYFLQVLKPQVTEDEARKEYDKQAAKLGTEEKVHARHILVADEKTAKEVHGQLSGNLEAFNELAQKYAPGSNTDLGFLGLSDKPEAIAKAAFALKVGQVSAPVKSEFGWHVIKIDERKVLEPQPFDKIKGGLIQLLSRQKVQAAIAALTKSAKIDFLDPDLKKLADKQKQQP